MKYFRTVPAALTRDEAAVLITVLKDEFVHNDADSVRVLHLAYAKLQDKAVFGPMAFARR